MRRRVRHGRDRYGKGVLHQMKKILVVFLLLMLLPLLYGAAVYTGGKLADRIITVSYPHHEIHEGNHYTSSFNNGSLGSGVKAQILINTPASVTADDKLVHMVIVARGSAEGRYEIWRSPTVTALGNALREENRNDNSANTAGVELTEGPTVSNAGTHLTGFDRHFGSGQASGGESRGLNEINLAPSTLYLINGVSEAANNDFTLEPDWYEDSGDAP